MPIIPHVGRKNIRMRTVLFAVYAALVVMSITTLYPLSIMLTNSVSSPANEHQYTLWPRYLHDDEELFRMYVHDKYGNFNRLTHRQKNVEWLNHHYRSAYSRTSDVQWPSGTIDTNGWATITQDFDEFRSTLDKRYWTRGFEYHACKRYETFLKQKYRGDIELLRRTHGVDYPGFDFVQLPQEDPFNRGWDLDPAVSADYLEFAKTIPIKERVVFATDMIFADFLQSRHGTIQRLDAKYNSHFDSFAEIRLPVRAPRSGVTRQDWEVFVRERWPFAYLHLTGGQPEFRQFLLRKYGSMESIRNALQQQWSDENAIVLPKELPSQKPLAAEWQQFVNESVPVAYIELDTPEEKYAGFLAAKYKSLESLTSAYHSAPGSFQEVVLPFARTDVYEFTQENHWGLKWEFLVRNYREVVNYVLLKGANRGRALVNTFVLVVATVLGALTINPLCAFALSRFKLRYAYKILIVLLATAAIPAEVTLIPSFLLVKNLGLLNTYWALVLPGLASGFSIFLLKGFFDSLPKELYEAATIEGASELYMFWQITLPLCKPIMALLALGAFASAYGGFMWAFMLCPNPELWTLMVFIYDFQRVSSQSIVMASLVIASLPTLLVFLFCQRIILQGIIVPSYK